MLGCSPGKTRRKQQPGHQLGCALEFSMVLLAQRLVCKELIKTMLREPRVLVFESSPEVRTVQLLHVWVECAFWSLSNLFLQAVLQGRTEQLSPWDRQLRKLKIRACSKARSQLAAELKSGCLSPKVFVSHLATVTIPFSAKQIIKANPKLSCMAASTTIL